MQVGNFALQFPFRKVYETTVIDKTDETPSGYKGEVSFADSPLYENYQLRPYNPAELWQKKGDYSIYDLILEDDQVSAVLALKKIITLSSGWEIVSEDQDVIDFITWNFTDLIEKQDDTFVKKLYEILSALDYGDSTTEIIADAVDYMGSTKFGVPKLKTRAPHSIEFHQDDKGNLIDIKQDSSSGQHSLPPDKFIVYSYNKKFDNYYGQSEINKGVYRAWWSKEAIIKFWNIFLERYGSPTPSVTTPRNAGVAEKNRVLKILKNWQAKTGISLPEGFEIELLKVDSGSASDGFERAIDKYNTMIARRMLLPDLMGFSGKETSGGSYSLGKEQFDIFMTIIDFTRQDIERLINKNLVSKLVLWNFGSKYQAKFKFKAIDADKKEQNLKLWLEAVKTGKVPVEPEAINWFLREVEAPEIEEKRLKEIAEAKDAMREGLINGATENKGDDRKPDKGDEESSGAGGATGKADGRDDSGGKADGKTEFKFESFRTLNKYEKAIDYQAIDTGMDEVIEEQLPSLASAYGVVINGLIADIKRKKIIEKRRIEQVNKLTLRNLGGTQKAWQELYKKSASLGKKEFAIIEETTGLDNEDVATWFKEFAAVVNTSEAGFILTKVKPVLMDAIRNGTGIRDVIKLLDESLRGYDIGLNRVGRLEVIARTNISTAFNEARAQEFESLGSEVRGYIYSAILDGRTSEICLALDSGGGENPKIYKPSELRTINTPNHFQCRSILIPVFEDPEKYTALPNIEQSEGGFLAIK